MANGTTWPKFEKEETFVVEVTFARNKWVPVTMAWRVLGLRMEKRHPIWRLAANISNKQSRTADKGWSSSLGLDDVLTTPYLKTYHVMNVRTESLGPGLIFWYDLSNGKGT